MATRRPLGPVFRPEADQGDTMPSTPAAELRRRWRYLRDGATLGAMLTTLARQGSMAELSAALHNLERDRLEGACMAMVLIHAQGAPMVDDDH